MKKLLLICLLVFLKFSFAENSFSRVPSNITEMIIEIPEAQPDRNVTEITSALQSLGGITVVGFCNSEKCIFLNVDRSLQPADDPIMRAITNLGYHPELKTSGTIQQAQDACKDRQ
jgi:hypothetical protein